MKFSWRGEGPPSKNYLIACRDAAEQVAKRPAFQAYREKLMAIAEQQSWAYALKLVKIFSDAAAWFYKGCPTHNIRYVKDERIVEMVALLLPGPIYDKLAIAPLCGEFWRGWQEGHYLIEVWTKAVANHEKNSRVEGERKRSTGYRPLEAAGVVAAVGA